MKHAVLIITCLAVAALQCLHAQAGLRPRGDVNCDWEVTVADVNAIIDTVITGAKYHSFYGYAADVNGDKEYTIADVNLIIDAILGDKLPPMPSYSGTLPVLYINTNGHHNIDSKEEYIHANWWLDAMGIEGYQSVGSSQHPLGMQIKGRGNATWTDVNKKSFRLKLDVKHEMMGMPSNKHWNLMAYPDFWMGKINDAVPFEIGRLLGMAWNPLQEPVELVLNGQYIGLYFLTEKIRVEKDRVNIIEQSNGETDPAKVTGGWLLEIDNYSEPGQVIIYDGDDQETKFTFHSPEELSDVQRDYITGFLIQADSAIYCKNKISTEWEKYIDIDALAIYYITQEVVDNPEAFSGSCYMYKERGEGTKLIFGPLWDCGSSFHRYASTYPFNDFIYENLPDYCDSHWIGEIAKFPHFQQRVRHHWTRFYNEIYPTLDAFIDAFAVKVDAAGNADFVRWPEYAANSIALRLDYFYRPCLHKKVAWLQSQWGYPDPVDPDPHPIDR